MSNATPIAIVGVGKIARDQHIPTIAANPAFDLVATVTRHGSGDELPNFSTIAALVAAMPDVRAVAICTPPRGRLALVREAFGNGLDVMLEKPPAATLGEAQAIVDLAATTDRVLHVTWHSRMAAAVAPARAWLAGRRIHRARIAWKENVRTWHPGQEWIWEPGIGVFDPGINALSVLTVLINGPIAVDQATLRFPSNKGAPIAADLALTGPAGEAVEVTFDFDQRGPQRWDIEIETDGGLLTLIDGASRMNVDGTAMGTSDTPEYAGLYARFAELIASRSSDVDITPFRLVADAFMIGARETVAPFSWDD